MLELYTFATPNNIKVMIALEELALPYTIHRVNLRAGEQKDPAFLALNPNGKVPVLVGHKDGKTNVLTESAAILVYLAEREGALLPEDGLERARVFEQLFFHASALGPAFGNAGYFLKLADEPNPAAVERFHNEAKRTLKVLDGWLSERQYVAGDSYSIADIAHFGWLWRRGFADIDLAEAPHVATWFERINQRPAVQAAIAKAESLIPQS
ncbi:glutathione S-transferase family protein [Gallaecimonas pentaromativorans]|uniref:glutathione S-transferase family protein n=1 Tax=Gallaecimonas pentaromativorans TaxID=584787 RepID=UPI003A8D46BC